MTSRSPRFALGPSTGTRAAPAAPWAGALLVLATLALAALALAAPALAGDWLVTIDGERIETSGPWRVEGRRVVFHLPNGTLTALRAEQVDLDQSRVASSEQPQPQPLAPAAAARPAVLVLTDENVARASDADIRSAADPDAPTTTSENAASAAPAPETAASGNAAAGASEAEASEAEISDSTANALTTSQRPDLEVTSWREETADNGVRFLGTLDNGSPDFAALLSVEVSLYDEAGALIDTRTARLATTSLAPGAATTFDITFDGVYAYGDAIFTPDGRNLRSRPPASGAAPAEDGDEPADGESADDPSTVEIAPEAAEIPTEPPPSR
jgi:hypothetical protein